MSTSTSLGDPAGSTLTYDLATSSVGGVLGRRETCHGQRVNRAAHLFGQRRVDEPLSSDQAEAGEALAIR